MFLGEIPNSKTEAGNIYIHKTSLEHLIMPESNAVLLKNKTKLN